MVNTQYDRQTRDLTQSTLRLRDDLTFVPQEYGGKRYVHIEVQGTSKFYRVGHNEYVFISLLDGETKFVEALTIMARHLGAEAFSQEKALQLYKWIIQNQLGTIIGDSGQLDYCDASGQDGIRDIRKLLNPFSIKLPIARPDSRLERWLPYTKWFFSKPVTVFVALLGGFAILVLMQHWERFTGQASSVFSPNNWLLMGVGWLFLKVVHELAHAICCKKHGGFVKEMGVMFILFAPLAYVDVTSSWRIGAKWKRIHIALAGMYSEWIVAALAILCWVQVDNLVIGQFLYNLVLMASVTTVLFNANPLMKFDGYYVFSDLIEYPNLCSDAAKALASVSRWVLWGDPIVDARIGGRQFAMLCSYGAACFAWRLSVCASLLIVAATLWNGLGIVIAAFGIVMWLFVPLRRQAREAWRRVQEKPASAIRGGVAGGLVVGGSLAFFIYVPSPTTNPTAGIVDFQELAVVRAESEGFLARILVEDGELIDAGQAVAILRNESIEFELGDLERQLAIAEQRLANARQLHQTALTQIETANIRVLREKLMEQRVVADALIVRSPVAGRVVERGLTSRLGTYVRQGDQLVTVGQDESKELVLSIAHDEIEIANGHLGQQVWVRVGGRRRLLGRLVRLDPRASTELTHPAMAATAGGNLLVVKAAQDASSESEQLVLTEPRFRAIVELSPTASRQLSCGERGYALIGCFEQSIGERIYRSASSWIDRQFENAKRASGNGSG